jgi:prepilin-type N-terminal cleavage/methylation domain-containing protein
MMETMKKCTGYTMVEIIVVIVVIGVLAAITLVAYTGIRKRAIIASVQSDLNMASSQIKLYYAENSVYPTSVTDCPSPATGNICVNSNSGNVYKYNVNTTTSPQTFGLTAVNSSTNISYRLVNDSAPIPCSDGFIVVPGNSLYGTSDFCVMKYEAKQVGSTNVPVSQAINSPWVNISQNNAKVISQNVVGCDNCHLITEAEWLTIAQNVLSVTSNWSCGVIGTGSDADCYARTGHYNYIYTGHNDEQSVLGEGVPIPATSDDSDGYYDTSNYSGQLDIQNGVIGDTQRRTLTLTNGEVIWDLAGNVLERTQGIIAGGQQPGLLGETSYPDPKEWNNSQLLQNGLPDIAMPGHTGLAGASGWSSAQGIGTLYSNYGETNTTSYERGGAYASGYKSGVFALFFGDDSDSEWVKCGFRVAQ